MVLTRLQSSPFSENVLKILDYLLEKSGSTELSQSLSEENRLILDTRPLLDSILHLSLVPELLDSALDSTLDQLLDLTSN